jgi:hypothetical protein
MQQHFFSFEIGELQKYKTDASPHCSSVQERSVPDHRMFFENGSSAILQGGVLLLSKGESA